MAQSHTQTQTPAPDAQSAPSAPVVERELAGHTVEFPVKFARGHRLSDNEAAHLNQFYLDRFSGNVRSDVERRSKSYSAEELLEKWGTYELGAPRGDGTTIREEAAVRFLRELAERTGKALMTARTKDASGKAVGKEAAQAWMDAQVARVLSADAKDATKSRVAALVETIRAERAERAKNAKPATTVDATLTIDDEI